MASQSLAFRLAAQQTGSEQQSGLIHTIKQQRDVFGGFRAVREGSRIGPSFLIGDNVRLLLSFSGQRANGGGGRPSGGSIYDLAIWHELR